MSRTAERVLVTGASGLIGRHVLPLLPADADVYALSRVERPSDGRVTWLVGDLGEGGTAHEVVTTVSPSVVIHLAGAVRGDRALEAVQPTLAANLVGTVGLLEAAVRAGVRRVVVSGSLLEEPASGDPSAVPPSPYGASRWAASAYTRMFHALFGLPVVILRPSYAYGPGQESSKLVPHVITSLHRGDAPGLASGDRRIDFVFAADVAEAYVAATNADAAVGNTIDLGSGALTPVRDVVEKIRALVGPDAPVASYGSVSDRPLEQEVAVDVERAKRLLGWKATTSLDDGLRRTIAYYAACPR
jgi:nucleoside-diphosphate-sugar epimerase